LDSLVLLLLLLAINIGTLPAVCLLVRQAVVPLTAVIFPKSAGLTGLDRKEGCVRAKIKPKIKPKYSRNIAEI
jgi:hypothetical protein